ncbi:hypothetical protein M2280_005874 [Prescottella agglutinans]|uniref:Uncharacterized protein n=1 Tax=Prescottella agglutinans TaxID=1644129 RepID=A0ABT6MJW4_9NOCA|nr:hypothetical protein [Prescottella agglutinans]
MDVPPPNNPTRPGRRDTGAAPPKPAPAVPRGQPQPPDANRRPTRGQSGAEPRAGRPPTRGCAASQQPAPAGIAKCRGRLAAGRATSCSPEVAPGSTPPDPSGTRGCAASQEARWAGTAKCRRHRAAAPSPSPRGWVPGHPPGDRDGRHHTDKSHKHEPATAQPQGSPPSHHQFRLVGSPTVVAGFSWRVGAVRAGVLAGPGPRPGCLCMVDIDMFRCVVEG